MRDADGRPLRATVGHGIDPLTKRCPHCGGDMSMHVPTPRSESVRRMVSEDGEQLP